VAVLIAADLAVRHFTGPEYVKKRLAEKIGPGYLVDIGSSRYNPLSRSFSLSNLSVVSDTMRAPRDGHEHPRTRMTFKVGAVRASGINLRALLKGTIDIDGIVIERPVLTLYVDRRGMPLAHARPAVRMPHEVMLASGRRIRISDIRVVDGDIRYRERSRDGVRPGEFRFADLNATIEHVNNDETQKEHPCVIEVRTRLAGSGPLEATFTYDLSSRPLRMDYSAVIGAMNAPALNDLLVDLNGIRIDQGTIDSTRLNIKVDGDTAVGTMTLLYHGLKFEILDKDTHGQNISDHLSTWVQNWKTHSSNPGDKDDPATVITLHRHREPSISLVKFVWETVREGVLRTVGAQ
jgi:hypothetical protein